MNAINKFDKRCEVLEEKYTFYNMREPAMKYEWSDVKTREVVE